jgi:uncharacterized protein YkwD
VACIHARRANAFCGDPARGIPPALRRKEAIGGVLAVGLSALFAAPAAADCARSADVTTAVPAADGRAALVCVISAERTARGLSAVRANAQLTLAAQRHSDDMVTRRFFSHVSPDGRALGDRVTPTGYLRGRRDWALGEAIGSAGEPLDSASEFVRAWLASPPHRAILLDPTFREVGIGLTAGLTDGSGIAGATAVLDFGFRSASPTLPRWRSRSRMACARSARASRQKPARCGSTSKRSTR